MKDVRRSRQGTKSFHSAPANSTVNPPFLKEGSGYRAYRSRESSRLPTIDESEVEWLSRRYGTPVRRSVTLHADEAAIAYRFTDKGDRRAEVVFAIEDPSGGIWVHAKVNYPRHIYRLPTGGIDWHESVERALLREIGEETALAVEIDAFLGLVEYRFMHEGRVAHFASYIFHARSSGGTPLPHAQEAIASFQLAPANQLTELAADLRNLTGERRAWGQYRAVAHDLVHERLSATVLSGINASQDAL